VSTLFIMKFILVLLCVIAVQLVGAEKDNPCSIDAAVTYTNDKIYFFKGDKYGRYDDDDDDDRKIAALSPISAWTGVPNDIDAVVKYRGNFYFFKGCYYYIFDVDADKVTYKRNINAWKAPCNLDSAFSWGDHVYLLKGNDYYEWEKEDGESAVWHGKGNIKDKFGVEGPFDAVVQWDENDYHYFFKGEDYWRFEEGGKLKNKSPITYWRGLLNGRELLRGCPCSCKRAGHNGNWKLKDIKYDFDKAVVKRDELKRTLNKRKSFLKVSMLGVNKCAWECPFHKETVEVINSKKESFTSTTTMGLKVGTSFKVGIPSIAEVGIKTELSLTQSFTFGTDKIHTSSVASTFTCFGYPAIYRVCTVNRYSTTMDVPYTMTLQHKTKDCTCPSKGIFHQEDVGVLQMKTHDFHSDDAVNKYIVAEELRNAGLKD